VVEVTEFQSTHNDSELAYLKLRFAECPIKTTLGALGKKWAMLILRDIGIYKKERFNRLLKSNPGITPRVLATRLKELETAGLIQTVEKRRSPMVVRWGLTQKGIDAIPILMMVAAFGSKYEAEKLFVDKRPRKLHELFNRDAMDLVRQFL
jgi:DNA-binding HxlR family transcriptional regulator